MHPNWLLHRLVIIFISLFLIFLIFLYSQYYNVEILYQRLQMKKNISITHPLDLNAEVKFLIDQSYWNFSLNKFLNLQLEADITPDIMYFVQNHKEYLKKRFNQEIPAYDHIDTWKSKTLFGTQIQSSTSQTIFIFISQIWYTSTLCNQTCDSNQNFVYMEALDTNYRRLSYDFYTKNEKMIRFPNLLPINQSLMNSCCSGSMNLRCIVNKNNELLIIFNVADSDKHEKVWIYNVFTNEQTSLSVKEKLSDETNQHWIPFIKNDKLHFIYFNKQLNILQCSNNHDACTIISTTQLMNTSNYLKDGTQLIRYQNSDYFVGIAYTKVSCSDCEDFYRPHIVVLSTMLEKFQLVYVSEPIVFDNIPLFHSFSIVNNSGKSNICYGAIRKMIPGSIMHWKWSNDIFSFSISINNQKSFLINIIGMGKIVQTIIFNIKDNYPKVLLDKTLSSQIISHSETTAFDYCKSFVGKSKLKFENNLISEQAMKKSILTGTIDSPTYPTFRVASNTDAASLKAWIRYDDVNFGLIGRYLFEYESVRRQLGQGASLMIDAGGNHGTYALYGAMLNQTVHVFEVLPKYCIVIEESLRINIQIQNMIVLFKFGISDQHGKWNVLPGDGITRLDFMKSDVPISNITQKDSLAIISYPLDDFIFRKVSVMKIDVEGFEIRALKGAIRAIRLFGVGAILIEIASYRWVWNNITINEGISVLEQVTSIGNYTPFIIARKDSSCPKEKISLLNKLKEVNNLSMINMQNGSLQSAPDIYQLISWELIINEMKKYDWSCNFWLESDPKRRTIKLF